jgi:hypothetical protein
MQCVLSVFVIHKSYVIDKYILKGLKCKFVIKFLGFVSVERTVAMPTCVMLLLQVVRNLWSSVTCDDVQWHKISTQCVNWSAVLKVEEERRTDMAV